ncbi:MAG TPA: hypothetical protein VNA13_03335 [Xanthomonadales bacterium]|nr:hypothetical protein [Xanthomonadales bacterium]
MTETFTGRNPESRRTPILTEANQGLRGVVSEADATEKRLGGGIRVLVQAHLRKHLQGETSIRGMGLVVGVSPDVVLDLDAGELYPTIEGTPGQVDRTTPLSDNDWFRYRQGVISEVTCLKYY